VIALTVRLANLPEVQSGHARFMVQQDRVINAALETAGAIAEQTVQERPGFKRRTGKTQDATTHKVVRLSSGRVVRIENKTKTAVFLEWGTRPHKIRARKARALRFAVGGKVLFRKSVNHPGTKPYKTFYRATFTAYRSLGPLLERDLSSLAARF